MKNSLSLAQIIAGLAMLVIGFAVNFIVNTAWPDLAAEYANPEMFRGWTDQLMMFYYVYPFILAIMIARIWRWVMPLNPNWQKFAGTAFLTMTIPGMLITYASFQISLEMILVWTITGLFQLFAAAWVCEKTIKQ